MSRTFKDKKEERAKRWKKEPHFSRSYRQVLEHGFKEDLCTCGCGAAMSLGDCSCEDSAEPKEEITINEFKLSNAA